MRGGRRVMIEPHRHQGEVIFCKSHPESYTVSLLLQAWSHSWTFPCYSLVPRHRPAFRRLQYGKAGRAWLFPHVSIT